MRTTGLRVLPPAGEEGEPGVTEPGSDEQAAAIAHGAGPCLVLAAPGSGKTYVIARRFVRLVRGGADPGEILALAYNRRAAEELQQRVERELGPLDGEPPLTTYHAWAHSLVRRFGWQVGLPVTVRIAASAERWLHLAAAVAEVRPAALYNPARPYEGVHDLQKHIERCKQELVDPAEYLAFAERRIEAAGSAEEAGEWARYRDLARVYGCLERRYREAGLVDHDDCIAIAARLLGEVEAVRDACSRLRWVMVDEFQDTNSAQAAMVERLVAPRGNLMVVADDDQAIYRFRGASRLNIERFREAFGERRELPLLVNRRSTPQIVALAQAVIGESRSREPKRVRACRDGGAAVRVVQARRAEDEAQAVLDRVVEHIEAGAALRDIAVLTQRRDEMEPIAQRLRAAEVPYVTSGGRDFFRTPEVKGVMALLEAIADPGASQALLACLRLPAFAASAAGRLEVSRALRDVDAGLADQLRAGGLAALDEADAAAVRRLCDTVAELHLLSQERGPREVFEEAMLRSDYARLGELPRPVERRQFAANVSRVYEILDEYQQVRATAGFQDALEYLRLMREAGAEPVAPLDGDVEGITLSTIHSAKGLEWPHVIVAAAAQDHIPRRARADVFALPAGLVPGVSDGADGHREEQRRLFYVALTRARDSLTITWSRRYRGDYRDSRRTEFLDPVAPRLYEAGEQPASPIVLPRPRRLPELGPGGELRLSYSLVRSFRDCPKRFEYQRVWRVVPVFSEDAWFGERLHEVLRRAMELRRAGSAVDEGMVAELWEAAWRQGSAPRGRIAHLFEAGLATLRAYRASELWREARPEWIEHAFSIPVEPASGWLLSGRIDRLDLDPGGGPRVIDYKSSGPRGGDLRRDLQLRIYAWVVADRFGVDAVDCDIHWLQTATRSTVRFSRGDLDAFRYGLLKTFEEIAAARRTGRFAARPSPWNCARCAYRLICPEQDAVAAG